MNLGEPGKVGDPSRRRRACTQVISEPIGAKSHTRRQATDWKVPEFPQVPHARVRARLVRDGDINRAGRRPAIKVKTLARVSAFALVHLAPQSLGQNC
jgi:hypothetical protein